MPPNTAYRLLTLITALVALAAVLATSAPPAAAHHTGALPTPGVPLFGPVLDPYASNQQQTTCSPSAKPGVVAFRNLVLSTYPTTGDLGIVRACSVGGRSEHKEGRAWDWRVDAHNPHELAIANTLLASLLRHNEYASPHALARRYGLMYIIWNRRIFRLYDPAAGWRAYTGANPHTDHVHFSFSWDGANQATTGWRHHHTEPNGCRARGDFSLSSTAAPTSVFRRGNGRWYVHGVTSGAGVAYGVPNHDVPCALDWAGNGREDLAVWRPSNGRWYVRGYHNEGIPYGGPGDIPVSADFNGNGRGDLAIYRPTNGRWHVRGLINGVQYGVYGDIPVPAKYQTQSPGAQIAVFRPWQARWFIRGVSNSGIRFGQPGDIPVPASYDGANRDQIAVFRPGNGTWYIRGGPTVRFGAPGDVPIPGDYNGNGRADLAVFRPSTGYWYIDLTKNGSPNIVRPYGGPGDYPVPRKR